MKEIVTMVLVQSLCYVRPFYLEQKAMPNLQQLVGENPRGQALRKAQVGGEG